MKSLDIIIPIYNERENIKFLLEKFSNILNINYKVFICYDFENESGLKFIPKSDKIFLIKNKGVGPNSAILTGIQKGNSDIIVVYMSDDFENINLLNNMFDLINDYDLIIPSRYIDGGVFKNAKIYKKFITTTGCFIINKILGIPYVDVTNAFKMFKRSLFNNISFTSTRGFTFALEIVIKSHFTGLKILEIPCVWKDLEGRKSNFKIIRWLPAYAYWIYYILKFKILQKLKQFIKKIL